MIKRLLLTLVICLCLVRAVQAEGVFLEGAVTVTTSVQSPLTISAPGAYREVQSMISVEGDSIRWRITGDPEDQLGHIAYAGDIIILDSEYDITNFKVILDAGGSGATLYYSLWGK